MARKSSLGRRPVSSWTKMPTTPPHFRIASRHSINREYGESSIFHEQRKSAAGQKRRLRPVAPGVWFPFNSRSDNGDSAPYFSQVFAGLPSGMRLVTMNRADSNVIPPPACEKCTREMVLVGALRAIADRQAVRVYKCLPCQRILSTPPRD